MKLTNMALVFVLIMVPMLLVFSLYVGNQNKTIEQQTNHDNKIMSATKDAISSLEMNTFGKVNKYHAATMRRTVQAAVNAFINSYSANFGITGYDKSDVLTYVPALLFTMYDGIYIYGPTTDQKDIENAPQENYGNYVLKPYIYYSARYKGSNYDVVINYALDNYITITGTVNSKYISKSGYLIDIETVECDDNGRVKKVKADDGNWCELFPEKLYEKITYFEEDLNIDGEINGKDTDYATELNDLKMKERIDNVIKGNQEPKHITKNLQYVYGDNDKQKYYYFDDNGKRRIFKYNSLGKIVEDSDSLERMLDVYGKVSSGGDTSAIKFYTEAYEFSKYVKEEIIDKGIKITPSTMVKPDGITVATLTDPNDPYYVFAGDIDTNILDAKVDKDYFTQHKLNIMQAIIKDNLNVAISTYSNDNVSDFYMPEISEPEWEKILTNISMVSFVQGMPMGMKTYNNYAIATSTNNEIYVNENSFYYVTDTYGETTDNEHHRKDCKVLAADLSKGYITAYPTTEFDKHTVNYITETYIADTKEFSKKDNYLHYYQHHSLDCYDCIVNPVDKEEKIESSIEYARIHAMARIKYNQTKTTTNK